MHELVHVAQRYGSAVSGYFQDLEIGVGDASGERAVPADAAGRRLRAEQELSDGHRGRELADVREALFLKAHSILAASAYDRILMLERQMEESGGLILL